MKTDQKTNGKVEILIAEDSPTQAARLAHLLEQNGHSVTTAANGRAALALLERRKPTLVISDIVMPELDGYGLCRAIKADKKLKDIPVMLVTTLSDPQDVIRALECGADNFLRKPYDERHLLSRIDYLLMNLELRTDQKMQMGMEIKLGGQKHFISSERQQILDLLISTYEQAVEINSELKQREKELTHSNEVLNGLYRVAEGLNQAASEQQVVEAVLERALELPGIQAGWISLREGEGGFRLAGARNLPPALEAPGAMEGNCACRRRLISGELDHVTNIMECERLCKAKGDMRGLRYHASVPLWLGDRTLGVMNLVGPDKGLFNEDELKVLYSVGNQVAVALERAHLHEHLERLVQERTAALEAEIGERKRIEEAQARLVAIIEATPDFVATGQMDGPVLYVNPSGLRMLGYEPGQDLSVLRWGAGHPDWALKLLRETGVPHAIEHGIWSGETAFLRPDGRERPVLQVIIAHKGPDGSIEYLSTIARDISERKRMEEWLLKLSQAVEQSPAATVITDTDGRIEYVNPRFAEVTGFTPEQLIGKTPSLIKSGLTPLHVYQDLWRTINSGEVWRGELQNRRQNGELYWEYEIVSSVENEHGEIVNFIAVKEDITERKRAEEEIRTLNADLERRVAERTLQLEEANRAKSDFLANMSHELRTPLNSIIGFSEMLKDGVLGELEAKQRGFVADIFDAGSHLLSLINDILDLSKVEAGMLQLEPGAVDVRALLKASTLVVREKAATHRIRLDTQFDPALGTVLADERKLKQIVYNLLSNAVKFTPDGGVVTLSARRCARAEVALDETLPGRLIALPPGEHNEFLAIMVEDSGVGIAKEHLPKLFAPFVQVDSSVARRQAGTGLGLSLVLRLAELHGGTVGVASRPGAGSRFCVWLPYHEAASAMSGGGPAPGPVAPSALEARASSTPAAPLALVIEDDDRMAELIAAQLRAEGFDVMRSATAEEGLVLAAKRRPQLITLDIFLPAMDGWEFLRRVRADPKLVDTPVVIITVSDDLDRGIRLGARRLLQKPFVREELMAALAGLVGAWPDGESTRVLVVDDNVKAVELLATAIEAEGHCVLRAYGGAEAIEVARSVRPDLLILDLMMPEVSGFEVVRALRESGPTAQIPILLLTTKDLTPDDHARLRGHVSVILTKASFNPSDLLAEVRRALPKRAGD
jgi:PAS domain S-box-containing protein